MSVSTPPPVGNYCVSFIDLLGQREALRGQTLLPQTYSEEEKLKLQKTLRNSVGAIVKLQNRAENIINSITPKSQLRAQLSDNEQQQWDEMAHFKLTSQRWSDGLVYFASLADTEVKCKMNSVFRMFMLAGTLCFMGLASKQPLRGAIEISWGVELHPGELYGAAVARAYEIESEVAQYPRIVVGTELLRFLELHSNNSNQGKSSQYDKELATSCLNMLKQDTSGHWMLHYLGEEFQFIITDEVSKKLYVKAKAFVIEQINEHRINKTHKLVSRYELLLQYFDAHQPVDIK